MKINFKILDNIRGIAALYVIINHCRGNLIIGGAELKSIIPIENWTIFTKIHYGLLQLTSLGSEFVVIFFVLSGFSISYSLQQNSKVSQFYKKRLIRLYPPFLVSLLYAATIYYIIDSTIPLNGPSVFNSSISIIKNIFYIPTGELIPQFWSLPLEVIFYIFAPIFLLSLNSKKIYYLLSLLIFTLSFFLSINNEQHKFTVMNFFLDYNIYFAIGVFLHSNLDKIRAFELLKHTKTILISSIILIPLMIYLNSVFGHYNKLSFLISSVYSIILITCFLNLNVNLKPLRLLGKISYTLYITHFASIFLYLYILKTIGIVSDLPIQNPFIWMGGVLFSVLIAIPFYYLAEKPTISLLTKLRQKP